MTNLLFEYFAARGGASLHAHGRKATMALLNELPADLSGPVLEIGCGTGETAVQLCNCSPVVVAADVSSPMLTGAVERARWCGVGHRMHGIQVSPDGRLPFSSETFAAVVVESVFAIQPAETLRRLVRETRRVVQPQGRVVVNETVWMRATPQKLAADINRRTQGMIGMIQATENPFDAEDWVELFCAAGLNLVRMCRLDELGSVRPRQVRFSSLMLRSRIYTIWRLLSLLMRGGYAHHRHMVQTLEGLAPPRPCLEGILFVLKPGNTL